MTREETGLTPLEDPAGHPIPEELLAYADGQLSPLAEEEIKQHLAHCQQCTLLVEDLAAWPELEAPNEAFEIAETTLQADLGHLRTEHLLTAARSTTEHTDRTASAPGQILSTATWKKGDPSTPASASWWLWIAAAATLLALGWGGQRQLELDRLRESLRTQATKDAEGLEALQRPLSNISITSLLATDDPLRSSEEPSIKLENNAVLAVIVPQEPMPPGVYNAEIVRAGGEIVERASGLELTDGRLTFLLPRGFLPSGEYTVQLRNQEGELWPTSFELSISP